MDRLVLIISCLIAAICAISGIVFYNYAELKSIERNIESAIVKGIDPISVRCSYSKLNDAICLAYAMNPQSIQAPSIKK